MEMQPGTSHLGADGTPGAHPGCTQRLRMPELHEDSKGLRAELEPPSPTSSLLLVWTPRTKLLYGQATKPARAPRSDKLEAN